MFCGYRVGESRDMPVAGFGVSPAPAALATSRLVGHKEVTHSCADTGPISPVETGKMRSDDKYV